MKRDAKKRNSSKNHIGKWIRTKNILNMQSVWKKERKKEKKNINDLLFKNKN